MYSLRNPVLPLLCAPLTKYQQTVWATQMYPLCQQIRAADIKFQKLEQYVWMNTSVPKQLLKRSYYRRRVQLEHTPLCTANLFCTIISGQLRFFPQCTAPTGPPVAFKPESTIAPLVLRVYRFPNKTYTLRHILEHVLKHTAPYVSDYFLGVSDVLEFPEVDRRNDYLNMVQHLNNRTRKCKCLFQLISSVTFLPNVKEVLVPIHPHLILCRAFGKALYKL